MSLYRKKADNPSWREMKAIGSRVPTFHFTNFLVAQI